MHESTSTMMSSFIAPYRDRLIAACEVLVSGAEAHLTPDGSNPRTRLHAARRLLSDSGETTHIWSGPMTGLTADGPQLVVLDMYRAAVEMDDDDEALSAKLALDDLVWHFDTEVARTVVALLLNSNLIGEWDDLVTRFAKATEDLVATEAR